MAADWISTFDDKQPSYIAGRWYPVLICYDPQEGSFPHGAQWDGNKWSERSVSNVLNVPCDTQDEACRAAHDNDPNW